MDRFRFKSRIYSQKDRWVFIVAFVAGAVFIVMARLLEFNWLPVLLSVLVIAAYTVYIFWTDLTSISYDQAADNAYYLGLLFTLVVLVYSLWKVSQFTLITSDTSNQFLSLLPDFGIALSSTIAGIAARVIIQQFRNDPADMEIQARQELGPAIQNFRGSLLASVAKFNDASKAMSVAVEEMEKRTRKTLEESVEANTGLLSQFSHRANELLHDFSEQVKPAGERIKGFADVVDTATDNIKKSTNILNAVTDSAAQDLKTLSTDLEKVRQQMKVTKDSHQTFTDELSNLAAQFSGFISKDFLNQMYSVQSKTLGQQEQLVSRLGALEEDITRIGQTLNDADGRISSTTEALEKQLTDQFGTIKSSAEQIGQTLNDAGNRISGTTEVLEKHLTSQFATIKSKAEQIGQKLGDTANRISSNVSSTTEELEKQLTSQFEIITSNTEQIGQKLDEISRKVPSIVASIEQAEASSQKVIPQLKDASIQLVDNQQKILHAFKSIQEKIQQMDSISSQALADVKTKKKPQWVDWFRR